MFQFTLLPRDNSSSKTSSIKLADEYLILFSDTSNVFSNNQLHYFKSKSKFISDYSPKKNIVIQVTRDQLIQDKIKLVENTDVEVNKLQLIPR